MFGPTILKISSHGWMDLEAKILVSDTPTQNLLGLKLHEQMGKETFQEKPEEIEAIQKEEGKDHN